MNEKVIFEQFTQHRCHTINQDVSTRGSSSAEQLTKNHGSKRPDLLYGIYVCMLCEVLKKPFSFTYDATMNLYNIIM